MTHVYGEVHVTQVPFSSEHWDVTPASAPVHAKVFVALKVGSVGFCVMVGAPGAIVSTTQVNVVVAPTFPAASTASTVKMCEPWASPEYDFGVVHAAGAAPSR